MMTMSGWIFLALAGIGAFAAGASLKGARRSITPGLHRALCVGVFALGAALRLIALGTLPAGLSAEEALTAVQAKSLWQTGGFFPSGGLSAMLAQWTGEGCGPLLAAITAPYVGAFGMDALWVRLPLALMSIAAMAAAYGVGLALAGRRAARWMLTIYALCPIFVLGARLAYGAMLALYLLPLAMLFLLCGMRDARFLWAGAPLMALTAYAQSLYAFIAPAAIVAALAVSLVRGGRRLHAALSCALGLAIWLPAGLTQWVNLTGAQGFTLLGLVEIPRLDGYDRTQTLMSAVQAGQTLGDAVYEKLQICVASGLFGLVTHANMDAGLFAPAGMGALFVGSIPVALLGAAAMAAARLGGRRVSRPYAPARLLALLTGAATLASLVLWANRGVFDYSGVTGVNDYAALFFGAALLIAAGMSFAERRSAAAAALLSALWLAQACALGAHLFGEGYRESANVYFEDFPKACRAAQARQEETGYDLVITSDVYPHVAPYEAAEVMYLCATDADMRDPQASSYVVAYLGEDSAPEEATIYLVTAQDVTMWDLSGFAYEEYGDYIVLTPEG